MQYEKHPETGEILLTGEQIKDGLAHRTIKRWAYICHDRDVYSEIDERYNAKHVKGSRKPRHWHIVIELDSNQMEVSVIARWFGIKENYVNVVKGAGAFLDCVEYLTHESDKQQKLGKRRYDDRKVKANFDFRKELNDRAECRMKYGKNLSEKDRIRSEVLFHGMKLREVAEKYPLQYQNDFKYLDSCRLRYLLSIAEKPRTRINYYVEGPGGIGKGLISKAIARAIVDREGKTVDDDIFFEGKAVSRFLVKAFSVRCGEDDLVVVAFRGKMGDEAINGFYLKHHTGTKTERVVVHLTMFIQCPVA